MKRSVLSRKCITSEESLLEHQSYATLIYEFDVKLIHKYKSLNLKTDRSKV